MSSSVWTSLFFLLTIFVLLLSLCCLINFIFFQFHRSTPPMEMVCGPTAAPSSVAHAGIHMGGARTLLVHCLSHAQRLLRDVVLCILEERLQSHRRATVTSSTSDCTAADAAVVFFQLIECRACWSSHGRCPDSARPLPVTCSASPSCCGTVHPRREIAEPPQSHRGKDDE